MGLASAASSRVVCRRKTQQSFAAPYTDDLHARFLSAVYDSEGRMDKFSQGRLIEFRYHAPHFRVLTQ